MHTPSGHESHDKPTSLREGYEVTDVSVHGITVFIVGLFLSVGVFFVFCYGLGIVFNNFLKKTDGPVDKWNTVAESQAEKLKMQSNPAEEQQRAAQLTQTFPTPRLETDDGNQDLAELHTREDLLLEHYSWADRSQGKVRIPIERAMELVAQPGYLKVAEAPAQSGQLMVGDSKPAVQAPLTNGFAPTAYEQAAASGSKE
jgi:hypothetical protein